MLFGKKKKTIEVDGKKIELQPKPGIFSRQSNTSKIQNNLNLQNDNSQSQQQSSTPSASSTPNVTTQEQNQKNPTDLASAEKQKSVLNSSVQENDPEIKIEKSGLTLKWQIYLEGMGKKHKGLEEALRKAGVKSTIYQFIQKMLFASIVLAIVVTIVLLFVLFKIHVKETASVILALILGFVTYKLSFDTFINYPLRKSTISTKKVDAEILFAANHIIVSMRSGMPLYNALVGVSKGYGEASKEFLYIVELVQLGSSLEDAIDRVVNESKSRSFRRIMLQASTSIKAGVDIISSLQTIIDQLSQERVIELRRYGQRLNALAMFYMIFGVILPSMGVAVLSIVSTFIPIFSLNFTLLEFGLVGIFFIQFIFLKMITSSRPTFTM